MNYLVEAADLDAHLFRVTVTLPARDRATVLKWPVWIPGSYMVREFSRHVVRIAAHAGAQAVPVQQVAKNAWSVAPCPRACAVVVEVYACDLSVRTAWLDAERGFFNGSSLLPYSDDTRHLPCRLRIAAPRDPRAKGWQVATTLRRVGPVRKGADAAWSFGRFEAADYDELIDKPVTLGRLQRVRFMAHGTPHDIVVTGAPPFDIERLAADVQRVCEAQIALFEPRTRRAPFERYCFMLHACADGYGGLEHRDSTALIARRADLPRLPAHATPPQASPVKGEGADARRADLPHLRAHATPPQPSPVKGEGADSLQRMTDGYVTLLGLFSHEYFHAWNVKRIRPRAFEPYDLERENLTRLLWLFEGFTSYYDDLMLLRAGLIDEARYLRLLARNVTSVFITPGRTVESVAGASYNAWLKYYRPDENTPNSTISYYLKGALVALALDLMLRAHGKHTLDDLMRHLWQRYKRGEPGVGEDELPQLVAQLSGLRVRSFFDDVVHGTADPALDTLLSPLGFALRAVADTQPAFGGKWDARDDGVAVGFVLSGGALQRAGLARGDLIVAVDGEQANRTRWDVLKAALRPGVPALLHYFRDGRLRETRLLPQPPATKEWVIERRNAPSGRAKDKSAGARGWPRA